MFQKDNINTSVFVLVFRTTICFKNRTNFRIALHYARSGA